MKHPENGDVLENGMHGSIKREAINCRLQVLGSQLQVRISSADKEANVRLAVKKILSQ